MASLLSLPAELQEHLLLFATVEDRVQATSTCRQLRHLGLSRPALWAEFDHRWASLDEHRLQRFIAWWLKKVKQGAGPRRLRLSAEEPACLAVAVMAGRGLIFNPAHVLLVLAGSHLTSLSLSGFGRLDLTQLVRGPRLSPPRPLCLERLELDCPDKVQIELRLPHEFSQLTSLTYLSLTGTFGTYTTFRDGCLPPGLRALRASLGYGLSALPPAITGATQLERLQLQTLLSKVESLGGLEACTRLTCLALRGFGLRRLPLEVLALPALRVLALSCNNLSEADLEPLTMLSALRELDLSSCCLAAIPPEVLEGGQLEALNLASNEKLRLPDLPAGALAQVKSLGLGLLVAIEAVAMEHIESMAQLSRIYVDMPRIYVDSEYESEEGADITGLLRALGAKSTLRSLTFGGTAGKAAGFPAPNFMAVVELARAAPGLALNAEREFPLPAELELAH